MQFVPASDKSKAFIREETLASSSITRDKKTITSRAIHGKSVVPEEKINNVFQFVTPVQGCSSCLINNADVLFTVVIQVTCHSYTSPRRCTRDAPATQFGTRPNFRITGRIRPGIDESRSHDQTASSTCFFEYSRDNVGYSIIRESTKAPSNEHSQKLIHLRAPSIVG